MTTDLKLPQMPEPLSCDIQFGSRQGTLLYHTAQQMREHERKVLKLCISVCRAKAQSWSSHHRVAGSAALDCANALEAMLPKEDQHG